METLDRGGKIKNRLFECIHNGEIENSDLVQIIEHNCKILNLQTISNYAKNEGISYNGAKKRNLEIIRIDGIKFIIDNK